MKIDLTRNQIVTIVTGLQCFVDDAENCPVQYKNIIQKLRGHL